MFMRRSQTQLKVSIHAPTKGATSFQAFMSGMYQFQSTLLRKERRDNAETVLGQSIRFNPRSYERSDERR